MFGLICFLMCFYLLGRSIEREIHFASLKNHKSGFFSKTFKAFLVPRKGKLDTYNARRTMLGLEDKMVMGRSADTALLAQCSLGIGEALGTVPSTA